MFSAAAITLARASPLVKRTQNFYMTGRLYYGQANLLRKEGRFKEAIEQYELVIGLLEQVKSSSDLRHRRKASENYGFIYDELIDTYYSLGKEDEQYEVAAADNALRYSELNKSRLFTNSWGHTFIDVLKHQLPAQLQERERALSAQQETLRSELEQSMSGQGHKTVKEVGGELQGLAKEQSALGNRAPPG